MSRRGRAILAGAMVTAIILVAAVWMSDPDIVTLLLAAAIGATVALSMWAREGSM